MSGLSSNKNFHLPNGQHKRLDQFGSKDQNIFAPCML